MNIGQRIKMRRKELGLSADELGRRLGKDRSTVYRYEKGDIENLPLDILEPIAEALGVSAAWIMGWEQSPDTNNISSQFSSPTVTTDVVSIPVIGEIAAGYNEVAQEDWSTEAIEVPRGFLKGRDQNDFFFLKVHGDSMYPLFCDGDMVLILKQSAMNYSGQVGAILYEDELATLKRIEYIDGEDWMKLVPINPNFAPQKIDGERLEHCKIIGIPKLVIRSIDG